VSGTGKLRTYLGSAPGVGKTYAMLNEGWFRAEAGQHVLVGWIERHGRAETRAQLRDLEIVEPRQIQHRGATFPELDLDAIIRRAPDVVLVDELAHTAADGSRRRWEDVADLRDAGIEVITTVNVANLVSARDYVATITGTGAVERVPDEVVRAGEVILVDPAPEILRDRIQTGRVFGAAAVGGALAEYFRPSNLEALSALGRAWMDDAVDAVGQSLLAQLGLVDLPPRPVVIAGVSTSAWGEAVIRRAATIAQDNAADLQIVHVEVADGLGHGSREALGVYRELASEVGASYAEVTASAPADGLADVARRAGARWVVLARHRSRLNELAHGSVASRLRRLLPDAQVIEVTP